MRLARAVVIASLAGVGAVVATASCEPARSPAPSYVVRLRLPLRDEASRACEAECTTRGAEGGAAYLECISGCPGAEIADGTACEDLDRRPAASCWVVEVREEVQPDGSVLLDILGAVATAGAIAATKAIENAGRPHGHVHRSRRDGG
ncbi:MAG: hypothetical protein JST00_38170 [Deltaproteobacteria bacterium]|nr:hypothetical protein [Deltaproteobacteria bacterium]